MMLYLVYVWWCLCVSGNTIVVFVRVHPVDFQEKEEERRRV